MKLPTMYPVTCHTCHVGPGSTFVAIDGFVRKGTDFIDEALARGATKIVVGDDARRQLAQLSSAALGNPAQKLKIIGVTGTKGKTSTTYLIDYLLRQAGYKSALLGSIKNKIIDDEIESVLTTPESDYLHIFFSECVKRGVTHVIMEVSSHAIALDRVHGLDFDIVGFTNLAPEHMDFHPTMEDYFATKIKLFSQVKPDGLVVINGDDEWGKRAIAQAKNCVAFSRSDLTFEVPSLLGEFNKYNILMACIICKKLGLQKDFLCKVLKKFPGIPGRLQMHVLKNGARAFVDYAHNPSSFEAVLQTLRPLTSHLIIVFGCGGDRDKSKRPVMGQLAVQCGDEVIVTNDNPRDEDPDAIINDICQGTGERAVCIFDRKAAIARAVALSGQDSIIALLGKGHESYYLCKGKRYRFNDFEEIGRF